MTSTKIRSATLLCATLSASLIGGAVSSPLHASQVVPAPHDSTVSTPAVSTVSSISIPNDGAPLGSRTDFGTINLTNNDVIWTATNDTAALANYENAVDMVRSGFDGGDWLGTGITSSFAALDHSEGLNNIAVGVILNNDGSGDTFWDTWDGKPVNQYDVLIKYTFYGDVLLNGNVSPDDVGAVASNIGFGSQWIDGQFFYTGAPVNGADLAAAQQAFSEQGLYPLTVPVPEPTSLLLTLMATAALSTACIRRRA